MLFAGVVAVGCFAASVSSHMFISSPVPITGSAPKNPLESDGSNWPCHLGKGLDAIPTEGGQTMEAGSNQTLAFELGGGVNSAVHGGGSCQMSITYETDVAKLKDPTNWKVIYSIEGGCPSDTSGNLEDGKVVACNGTTTACVNSFPFTIPKGVKNGHAIMSWTWFNTIGNREIYQNCINTEITGGDGSEMDDLPAMFMANLPGVGTEQCTTKETTNLKFPNPGKYVIQATEGSKYELADPICAAGSSSGTSESSAVPSSYSVAQPSAYSVPAPSAYSAPAPSAYSAPAPSSYVAPQQSTLSTVAPSPTSSTPATNNTSSCPSGQVSCTSPGTLICIDSTHFGICDIDLCAVSQAVADGTQCSHGAITRKRKRGTLGLHGHTHKHVYGPKGGIGNGV